MGCNCCCCSGGGGGGTTCLNSAAFDAMLGGVVGSLIYRGPGAWTTLGPGPANWVLTSGGADQPPYWAPPVNEGGWPEFTAVSPVSVSTSSTNIEYSLAVGDEGQVLTTVGGVATWVTPSTGTDWTFAATTPVSVNVSGTTVTYSLVPGTTGQVLTTTSTGVAWATPSGGGTTLPTTPVRSVLINHSSQGVKWLDTPYNSSVLGFDNNLGVVDPQFLYITQILGNAIWHRPSGGDGGAWGTGNRGLLYCIAGNVHAMDANLEVIDGGALVAVRNPTGAYTGKLTNLVPTGPGQVLTSTAIVGGYQDTPAWSSVASMLTSGLPAGTNGQVLTLVSGSPAWAPSGLPTPGAANTVLVSNGTTATWVTLSALFDAAFGTGSGGATVPPYGAAGTVWTSTGTNTAPQWKPLNAQPTPASSTLAVGTLAMMQTAGSVAAGASVAGSSLHMPYLIANSGSPIGTVNGGAAQAGTWLHLNGASVNSDAQMSYFVRTA